MVDTPPPTPYETHLDIRYGPLEVVDAPALVAAVTHPWWNQTLCRVNESVVRLALVFLHRTRAPERWS